MKRFFQSFTFLHPYLFFHQTLTDSLIHPALWASSFLPQSLSPANRQDSLTHRLVTLTALNAQTITWLLVSVVLDFLICVVI